MNLPSQAPATSANPEQARVQLVETSIVFVANQLNLSIFNPLWFVKQGILREDEFTAETVITPAFVQIPTSGFNLLIIPDRLQMQLLPRTFPIAANEFHRVLGGIIKSLPHTPLKGVGLNFSFMSVPPKGTACLLYTSPSPRD